MLKQLRKKGVAKKILWFIAIIIIITFGFFGTAEMLYTKTRKGSSSAGKIFGETVTPEQFQKSLFHTRNQAILRYGDNFYKINQFLRLESEAWDRLILLHEAKQKRIKATDQEVVDTIAKVAVFQRNGQFDPILYQDILRYVIKCKPRDFEEGIRGSVIFNKLFEQEAAPVVLSPEEIWEGYQKQNQKVQISYALFSPDDYKKDVTAEEPEVKTYYDGHQTEFSLPPAINIEYLSLPFPENATQEQKDAVSDEADKVFLELKDTPDLKTVGEKHNLTPAESGFFSLEQPNLKIGLSFESLKKSFELPTGQISDPLESGNGYFLIKVKERQDARIPDYAEASPKAKDAVLLEKAKAVARQKAGEYLEKIRTELTGNPDKKFTETAQAFNLNVVQTPPFNRGQYLPTIGLSKEFQDVAFTLNEKNRTGGPVETAKGYAILNFDSTVPVEKGQFEKEKDTYAAELLQEKKNEAFNNYMIRMRLKANLEDNISKAPASQEQ